MSSKYELKSLKLYDPKSGKYGASLEALVSEISITESIDFPGIRATISITDSVGGYTKFNGGEYITLQFSLPDLSQSKSYFFKVYRVGPIIRMEKRAKYNIECKNRKITHFSRDNKRVLLTKVHFFLIHIRGRCEWVRFFHTAFIVSTFKVIRLLL